MRLSSLLPRLAPALVLIAVAACQSPAPQPGSAAALGGGSPLVPPLPPLGVEPVPAVITRAQEAFVQGVVAFGQGSYAEAAATFLRVAESMRPSVPGAAHAEVLAANRVFAYRNATIAFVLAGTPDEAHRALGEAAAADPDCEAAIRELLALLPPRTGAPREAAAAEEPDAGSGEGPLAAPDAGSGR